MKVDQYSRAGSTRVKARANYQCELCGSSQKVQAHAPDGDHSDWRKGICLCGECHSRKHPNLPRALFLTKGKQPYWHNTTASELGREFNCHNRTVIRAAKALGIPSDCPLSAKDKDRLRKRVYKEFKARGPRTREPGIRDTEILSVRIPKDLLPQIDATVKRSRQRSRNNWLNWVIKQRVRRHNTRVAKGITTVYNGITK